MVFWAEMGDTIHSWVMRDPAVYSIQKQFEEVADRLLWQGYARINMEMKPFPVLTDATELAELKEELDEIYRRINQIIDRISELTGKE